MESNFFRRLARELDEALRGGRIQKIYQPVTGLFTFEIGRPGKKWHLLLLSGSKDAALLLAAEKPENPAEPDSRTMWLRKRLVGRRILGACADWPGRRLALQLGGESDRHVILDLREGVSLADNLDPAFGRDPEWPTYDEILRDEEIWREAPHLSPPLRRALARLEPAAASALLDVVRGGESDRFWVWPPTQSPNSKGPPLAGDALAWPYPPWKKTRLDAQDSSAELPRAQRFETALQAAAAAYGPRVFGLARAAASSGEEAQRKRRLKRLRKLLQTLDKEEMRLIHMTRLAERGEAIKARLYDLQPNARLAEVLVWSERGELAPLALDPSLTVLENMEKFFRLAAKGKRGLPHVAARRTEVENELDAGGGPVELLARPPKLAANKGQPAAPAPRGKAAHAASPDYRRFRTSDGFLVLRGRSSAGNHRLLSECARPYDYWLHAASGPGSHCILKRDFPDQPVPESSLREAAVLAGLRSWQAEAGKAEVLCALVKDVRKVKGLALGAVRVDKAQATLLVELDLVLEQRLALDAPSPTTAPGKEKVRS
jgi:predicted ribosome quality control (RQC) complex YloA/Tae2 family protein